MAISPIVRTRPAASSGCTSPNPTVVSVIRVMYRPSRTDHPSTKTYPSVPTTITSRTARPRSLSLLRGSVFSAVSTIE